MTPGAPLLWVAAALGIPLGLAYAFYRYTMRILVANLMNTAKGRLDFSSVLLPEGCPERAREDAPLVLFLHEFAGKGESYRKYVLFLEARGYRVVAPDFPDAGEAAVDGPRMFVSCQEVDFARQQIRAARDQAAGAPFVVHGVSRGGGAALAVLAEDPMGVDALVVDSALSNVDMLEVMIRRLAPAYLGQRLGRSLPRWFLRLTARRSLVEVGQRLGVVFPNIGDRTPRLTVPTLQIHGARDRAVPKEVARRLNEQLPAGTELWLAKGAKHNEACLAQPEAYQEKVTRFLEAQGAGYGEVSADEGEPSSQGALEAPSSELPEAVGA